VTNSYIPADDRYGQGVTMNYTWRGEFTNTELNALHAEAFETRVFSDDEWDWQGQVDQHSFGWVVARDQRGSLVGFVNVVADGLVHAWIQDVMVSTSERGHSVGRGVVRAATDAVRDAGYEWLHVDFDDDLRGFYIEACGFTPTNGGLLEL
jgi:GNAT superfamily N-acetyltransferase